MPIYFRPMWAALVLLSAPAASAAQEDLQMESEVDLTELSLEELLSIDVDTVYGASKREQKVTEAPSAVTIVTREDIRRLGYRTLADVLSGVRGFHVTDDRNSSRLGVRGLSIPGDYNSRVLVLIDGQRVNDEVFNSAGIDRTLPVDLDLVERIEIVRGPGSALYGSNAVFAVIDVITRRGDDLAGFEVQAGFGSQDSYETRVSWGRAEEEGPEVLVSATFYDSAGDSLYYEEYEDEPGGGRTNGTENEQAINFFARISQGAWTFQANHVNQKQGIPTGAFGTVFDDPRTRSNDQQTMLRLGWTPSLAGDWSFSSQLSYQDYSFDGYYLYDYDELGIPPFTVNRDVTASKSLGLDLLGGFDGYEGQRWTFGAEVRRLFQLDQSNFDDDVYFEDERDGTLWGVFVQDELQVTERTTLSLGLRHDDYSTFGGTTNPRIALIHRPDETVSWKLLAGRAFRAPSALELYYNDGEEIEKANPDLEPETIQTYEAVVEKHFADGFRGSISVFHYEIEDQITQVLDPDDGLLFYENVGSANADGVELELEKRWANGWRSRLAPSWQHVRERGGNRLVGSPEHMVKMAVSGPVVRDGLTVGLELLYTGERPTLAGDSTGSALVVNGTLLQRALADGVDLTFGVKNLLDEDYADPAGSEHVQDLLGRDGRTWFMRLTASF